MKVIVCVDNAGGMLFGTRRQSRDRVLCEDVQNLAGDHLKIGPFSASLFPELQPDPDFLQNAGPETWCFVEDQPLLSWQKDIDEMAVYCWNRDYPHTALLDLIPAEPEWHLEDVKEFAGSSHDCITRQIWRRTCPDRV